jgi:hypothetical protein
MTFVAPIFLAGLLAGLLPVLLHLIHRHKAPDAPLSTLRFLRLSVQRTRRRKYIDDLALLVARVAVLVLLALALANPVVTTLGLLWGGGASTAVVILFDNSASMATQDAGKPRLETARKAAEQVLDHLREGDAVAFFPTGGPTSPEQGKLYSQHETVRQAVGRCQVNYERADLAGKLQAARALLADSDLPNREIYVITDNQAVSWQGLPERTEDAAADEPHVPVIVIQVNSDPVPNVALRNVRLETPAPAVGVPITASVEVFNPNGIGQQRNVELYLDGRKEQVSPTLNLSPGASLRQEFRFTLDRPGLHQGEVRLAEEDGCPLDNRLFFTVTADEQISVAVVTTRRNPVAYADDSFYLERVLAPTGASGWAIRPQVLTADALATEPLAGHAVVFCVNLPAPEPAVADRLREYVERGGHLFWICGENVRPEDYNRMNERAEGTLLPAKLAALRAATPAKGSWKIAALDRDHPALHGLTEPASLYQSVLVHKHFPLTLPEDAKGRVLARLEGEQPLLVERPVGAGSVLLLGTGMHVEWTNLPLRPLFLPLVARLTFRLAGVEAERSQVLAGRPFLVPLPAQAENIELEVTTPAGEVTRTPVKSDGRFFRFTETHEAGTYLFRWTGARAARPTACSVNIDPDESDPAVLTQEELTRRLGPETLVFCDDPDDVAGVIHRLREGQSLWELFLGLALGVLMLEVWLANGRRARPGACGQDRQAQPPVSTAIRGHC